MVRKLGGDILDLYYKDKGMWRLPYDCKPSIQTQQVSYALSRGSICDSQRRHHIHLARLTSNLPWITYRSSILPTRVYFVCLMAFCLLLGYSNALWRPYFETYQYIDDIIVTGAMKTDHLKSLEEVLRWLAEARLHTKKHKCTFLNPSVSY